jgi:WD40 repeat protein
MRCALSPAHETITNDRQPSTKMEMTMPNKLITGCLVALLAIAANRAECEDAITFQAHDDGARLSLAISPDGKTLATVGSTKSIKLWNVGSQEKIGSLDGHEGVITMIRFSPNGQLLVSASADKSVRFWHVETRKQHRRIDLPGPVADVSFSPDGKRLAVALFEEILIHIINVATGEIESVMAVPGAKKVDGSRAVACVEFSPDGKYLVAAVGGRGWPKFLGEDSVLAIWDAKTMKIRASFVADRHNPFDLAISPDSKTIATACHRSKVIKLWKLDVPEVRLAEAKVVEKLIAQLDDDAFAKRQDAQKQLKKIGPAAAEALRKAVGATKSLELRERGTFILKSFAQNPVTVLPGTGFDVHSVAFSPDGKFLASGRQYARPGHLVIWDLSNANRRITAPNTTGAWCVAFFPNGGTLASGSKNGRVTLWDVKTLFAQ